MRTYSIFAPKWSTTSGGVRVMYGLYGWLLAKGQVAFLNQYTPNLPHVAIYPEIYPATNPSNAERVVRYILNKPGVVSAIDSNGNATLGPSEFPETDIKYYFSRLFGETQDQYYMFLPILNMHVFKDHGIKRTKTAYFVGKGVNLYKHPEDAVLIDREFAQDQDALAELLNECKVLYSYDPVSAMGELARLCGCPMILMQDWFTHDEYRNYEPGLNGISFDPDEIPVFDVKGFRTHYVRMVSAFSHKLDMFISETQK